MNTISYHDLGLGLVTFLNMHPSVIDSNIIGSLYNDCLDIEVVVNEAKYIMDCLTNPSNNIEEHVNYCKRNLNNVHLKIIYA